jgi:hypothetical protein
LNGVLGMIRPIIPFLLRHASFHAGLYNPHTLNGDIVVNGVKTSSYTATVAPGLAHAALWPIRMLYTLGYDIINGAFDHGSALITSFLPRGADRY